MEKVIKGANNVWKFVIALMTLVTLTFGSIQAYQYFDTPDISGEWYLTLTNTSSTRKAYVGDVTGLKVFFTQTDKSISGQGEKWEYRGQLLDYNQHRKLEFVGKLDGKIFKTSFVLHGELRETTGIMELEITDGGKKMIGTFSGTAADTKGTIIGIKK